MQELPQATHGHFTSSKQPPYSEGDTATLICDQGFAPEGLSESTLIATNNNPHQWKQNTHLEWRPPSARCVPATNELPQASNGVFTVVTGPPYLEGTVAVLECDRGYSSSVRNSVLKIDNIYDWLVRWDPPSATCTPVGCPPPPTVEHGSFEGLDYTFSKRIRFECDEGYRRDPSLNSVFHCGPSQTWQPPIPSNLRCDPVQCPELQPPENGTLEMVDRVFGSVARYRCEAGYRMSEGDAERTCMGDGTWSGSEAKCVSKFCTPTPEMQAILKSMIATTAVLDCGGEDEETVLCLNGKWSKDPPYCTGKQSTKDPLNPNVHVSVVSLHTPKKPPVNYIPNPPPQAAPQEPLKINWFWVLSVLALFCSFLFLSMRTGRG